MGVGLAVIAVLVPALALFLEHAGNVRIAERHHSHHDTYVVPVGFTRSLVLAMTFMGVSGLLLARLALDDGLGTSAFAVMAFFDAFICTCFVLWWISCRYKVSVFEDHLVITPFLGDDVEVVYDRIERMEWVGVRRSSGYRSLDIYAGGEEPVRLSSIVDVAQILMSIDRFDVLPRAR